MRGRIIINKDAVKICTKCKVRAVEDSDQECKVCERKFHLKQINLMDQVMGKGKRKRINEI